MNRLMVARPLLRTLVKSNVVVAQRTMSGHHYEDIGPPASFNQLPQPEGDWKENHARKQRKYNAILLASATFLAFTFGFMKQSEILYFNACPPETYE